jgi:hypothetical protein
MGLGDMVLLTTVVHPIDVETHPSVPPGYRWAVMLGPDPTDMDRCANAGWCPTRGEAEREGDQNAATATRALQLVHALARYGGVHHLDHDPIPTGGDRLNFLQGA